MFSNLSRSSAVGSSSVALSLAAILYFILSFIFVEKLRWGVVGIVAANACGMVARAAYAIAQSGKETGVGGWQLLRGILPNGETVVVLAAGMTAIAWWGEGEGTIGMVKHVVVGAFCGLVFLAGGWIFEKKFIETLKSVVKEKRE